MYRHLIERVRAILLYLLTLHNGNILENLKIFLDSSIIFTSAKHNVNKKRTYMQEFDWGQVTPEGANLNTNIFIYVCNHDLTSMDKIDRTIRFLIGRLLYYNDHLPKNPIHKIKIDVRGQQINKETWDFIIGEIKHRYPTPDWLDIHFIK